MTEKAAEMYSHLEKPSTESKGDSNVHAMSALDSATKNSNGPMNV